MKSDDKPAKDALSFSVQAEQKDGTWLKIDVVTVPAAGTILRSEHKSMVSSMKDELMILLASGKIDHFIAPLHAITVRKLK